MKTLVLVFHPDMSASRATASTALTILSVTSCVHQPLAAEARAMQHMPTATDEP